MTFYALLPYIKYVTRANEIGMANVLLESLEETPHSWIRNDYHGPTDNS